MLVSYPTFYSFAVCLLIDYDLLNRIIPAIVV